MLVNSAGRNFGTFFLDLVFRVYDLEELNISISHLYLHVP
jgi:hypothetical protein